MSRPSRPAVVGQGQPGIAADPAMASPDDGANTVELEIGLTRR